LKRSLDHLATVEIFAYRTAVLISFLVYAFKHIKAEWFAR
jgi:hypothetical protein